MTTPVKPSLSDATMLKDEVSKDDRQFTDLFDQLIDTNRKDVFCLHDAHEIGLLSHMIVAWEDDEYVYVFEEPAS